MDARQLNRRIVVMAAITMAPALILAAAALVTLSTGLTHHWQVFYAPPAPGTTERLMQAIADKDLAEAASAIANGADPNVVGSYSHASITEGRVQYLRPLVVAAAQGDDNMVAMLVGAGANVRPILGLDGLCAAGEIARRRAAKLLANHQLRMAANACDKSARLAELENQGELEPRLADVGPAPATALPIALSPPAGR